MRARIIAVGRIRDPFTAGQQHYLKMLRPHLPVEVVEVKRSDGLERRLEDSAWTIALDPGGRQMDSIEWGAWLDERRMAGRNIEFLIGGPEGLPSALVEGADERISLGRMTLAHQLARVVLLEQLFRAGKISAGERYHL